MFVEQITIFQVNSARRTGKIFLGRNICLPSIPFFLGTNVCSSIRYNFSGAVFFASEQKPIFQEHFYFEYQTDQFCKYTFLVHEQILFSNIIEQRDNRSRVSREISFSKIYLFFVYFCQNLHTVPKCIAKIRL